MEKSRPVKYFRCLSVSALTFTFLLSLFISCEVCSANDYPNSMDRLEFVFGEDFEKNDTDNSESTTYTISPTKYPILRPKGSTDNDTEKDYDDAIMRVNTKRYFDNDHDEWETQSDLPYENPTTNTENVLTSTQINEITFLPSDVARKCILDQCPNKTDEAKPDSTTTTASPRSFAKTRPDHVDFQKKPFLCRCDEACRIYGDCCWNLAGELTVNNPWRCNRLQHEKTWVLMISTCLPGTKWDLEQMCTKPELIARSNYTYHLDIPVYSHITKKIYKNMYCAHCNGVNYNQILYMEKKMLCSKEMDTVTLETFIKRAQYSPGRRYWYDLDIYCGIYMTEFESSKVEKIIPNIRFCGPNAMDYCPENSDERTKNLCLSYTQHVQTRETGEKVFKNHHCAMCHIEGMEIQYPKKQRLTRCQVYLQDFDSASDCPTGFHSCTRVIGEPSNGTATRRIGGGISLLFDFTFAFEGSYVGYEYKCHDDEIWDYLHQKCHPIMCPKDHILKDRVCVEIVPEREDLLNTTVENEVEENSNSSQPEIDEDLVKKCFTILLNENEYEMLENETIVFNKTILGIKTQLRFSKLEYERWNNTTVSVCATELQEGFQPKFPKELYYVSLVALGISVASSTLHILLYILLPKLRNLPGQNLVCLTLSILISQLIFLTLIEHQNRILCIGAAIIMHYFFLQSFCWMFIMSFDIWRTFSSEFLVKRQSNDSTRTFIKYSAFAWISPALVVLLAVITDFALADDTLEPGAFRSFINIVQPLYGHNNLCWINQGLSLLVFFALPVAFIILANLTLFLLTAQSILRQHREANRVLKSNDSRATCVNINNKAISPSSTSTKKSNEVLVKLYWKLALIMGLTWILGFVANSTGWNAFWYLFVFFNGSQGTFIFLAFDCKPKVWNMIKERVNSQRKRRESSADMRRRGTATSTTSAGNSNTIRKTPF